MNPVNHVAIIMDGNGRWGIKHKNSRNAGHRAGLDSVEMVINNCIKENIQFLTLYTFSSENWRRPKKEIIFLFNLLEVFLKKKINKLIEKDIKLNSYTIYIKRLCRNYGFAWSCFFSSRRSRKCSSIRSNISIKLWS